MIFFHVIAMYEICYVMAFMLVFFALLEDRTCVAMRVLIPHPCEVCGKHHGPMLEHKEEE